MWYFWLEKRKEKRWSRAKKCIQDDRRNVHSQGNDGVDAWTTYLSQRGMKGIFQEHNIFCQVHLPHRQKKIWKRATMGMLGGAYGAALARKNTLKARNSAKQEHSRV